MPHAELPELKERSEKLNFSEYPFIGQFIGQQLGALGSSRFSEGSSLKNIKSLLSAAEWLINPSSIPEGLAQNTTLLTQGFEQVMNLESALKTGATGGPWDRNAAGRKTPALLQGITNFVEGVPAGNDGHPRMEKVKEYEPSVPEAPKTSAWSRSRAERGNQTTEKTAGTPSKGMSPSIPKR